LKNLGNYFCSSQARLALMALLSVLAVATALPVAGAGDAASAFSGKCMVFFPPTADQPTKVLVDANVALAKGKPNVLYALNGLTFSVTFIGTDPNDPQGPILALDILNSNNKKVAGGAGRLSAQKYSWLTVAASEDVPNISCTKDL
jgi:hypothetical protein